MIARRPPPRTREADGRCACEFSTGNLLRQQFPTRSTRFEVFALPGKRCAACVRPVQNDAGRFSRERTEQSPHPAGVRCRNLILVVYHFPRTPSNPRYALALRRGQRDELHGHVHMRILPRSSPVDDLGRLNHQNAAVTVLVRASFLAPASEGTRSRALLIRTRLPNRQ